MLTAELILFFIFSTFRIIISIFVLYSATCSAIFALQHAVREARRELRNADATNMEGVSNGMEWIQLDSPATCEKLELLCDVKAEHLAVGNV